MLFKDAMASAQEATRVGDRRAFATAVQEAQSLAQQDAEMVSLLEAALDQFPEMQAFTEALELSGAGEAAFKLTAPLPETDPTAPLEEEPEEMND